MRIFQKGFNFSQDGPGNRLVYHIAGCNMHCPWCSNPEGMTANNNQKQYTPEDIIAEAVSCKSMFFGGGGVTFTGGEATLCFEELKATLKGLKENQIHTAIETNGTSPTLSKLLPYVDYLMMDFKHYDGEMLKKHTGLGNEIIKKNYEANCNSGRQQHIRIPLISGINTDNPKGFAEYFAKFNTDNTVFEFLAYHEYGKEKWQEEYKIKNGFVSAEKLKTFIKIFNDYNLKIIKT